MRSWMLAGSLAGLLCLSTGSAPASARENCGAGRPLLRASVAAVRVAAAPVRVLRRALPRRGEWRLWRPAVRLRCRR